MQDAAAGSGSRIFIYTVIQRRKETIRVSHQKKAKAYFQDGIYCPQEVLAACADEPGLTEEQAFKAAHCLSGGM